MPMMTAPTNQREPISAAVRLDRACRDLIGGGFVGGGIERVLRLDPGLAADPDAVLDLIDAEYCGRCAAGESPDLVAANLKRRFADLRGLDDLLAILPTTQPDQIGEPVVGELRTVRVLSPTARLVRIDAGAPTMLYRGHQVENEPIDRWVSRQRAFRAAADRLPGGIVTPHAVSVGDGVVHWMRPWIEGVRPPLDSCPPEAGRGGESRVRLWTDTAWLLAALHAAGFYHGQIDCGLLIDHHGRPHLIDAMVNGHYDARSARQDDWRILAQISGLSPGELADPMAAGEVR